MPKMFVAILALVLFVIAAAAPVDPWRLRLVAAGLAAWEASTIL